MGRRGRASRGRGAGALFVVLLCAALGAGVYGLGVWLALSGDWRIVLLVAALAAGGAALFYAMVGARVAAAARRRDGRPRRAGTKVTEPG